MKKILVTGSLGYIGSVLAPYLEERGFKCVGYDTGFFKDGVLYPPKETETILKDARDIDKADLKRPAANIHDKQPNHLSLTYVRIDQSDF